MTPLDSATGQFDVVWNKKTAAPREDNKCDDKTKKRGKKKEPTHHTNTTTNTSTLATAIFTLPYVALTRARTLTCRHMRNVRSIAVGPGNQVPCSGAYHFYAKTSCWMQSTSASQRQLEQTYHVAEQS